VIEYLDKLSYLVQYSTAKYGTVLRHTPLADKEPGHTTPPTWPKEADSHPTIKPFVALWPAPVRSKKQIMAVLARSTYSGVDKRSAPRSLSVSGRTEYSQIIKAGYAWECEDEEKENQTFLYATGHFVESLTDRGPLSAGYHWLKIRRDFNKAPIPRSPLLLFHFFFLTHPIGFIAGKGEKLLPSKYLQLFVRVESTRVESSP
jgi:hypothetical protein